MAMCSGCGRWNKRTPDEERCWAVGCYKYGKPFVIVESKYIEEEDKRQKSLSICRYCKDVYDACRCDWKEKERVARFLYGKETVGREQPTEARSRMEEESHLRIPVEEVLTRSR